MSRKRSAPEITDDFYPELMEFCNAEAERDTFWLRRHCIQVHSPYWAAALEAVEAKQPETNTSL